MPISILLYHLVRDDLQPGQVVIGTKKFAQQMYWLWSNGYRALDLKEWFERRNDTPQKSFILTFDDGFADVYENAWPVLKEVGFPFTIFLVSDYIGAMNHWKGLQPGKLPLLKQDQILEMAEHRVSFGAHSRTHPSFYGLDKHNLHDEIHESRSALAKIIGDLPSFFAFPYGEFTEDGCDEVRIAGYLGACTTLAGRNNEKTNRFRLRRVYVSGTESLTDFRLKVNFGRGFFSGANLKANAKSILQY